MSHSIAEREIYRSVANAPLPAASRAIRQLLDASLVHWTHQCGSVHHAFQMEISDKEALVNNCPIRLDVRELSSSAYSISIARAVRPNVSGPERPKITFERIGANTLLNLRGRHRMRSRLVIDRSSQRIRGVERLRLCAPNSLSRCAHFQDIKRPSTGD